MVAEGSEGKRWDAGAADLRSGEMRVVTAGDRNVLVVNVDGALYAIDGACSHEDFSLADGILYDFDRSVLCSLHGSRFDLASGAVIDPPATRALRTHQVSVESGRLLIEVAADQA
jgi:3-phenylpropionate/trans-cinnamate dioxygenase ferredoxin subunit